MKMTRFVLVVIVLLAGGLGGCDGPSHGERVERNIDRSMKDLEVRLESVSEEIEEDAEEEDR